MSFLIRLGSEVWSTINWIRRSFMSLPSVNPAQSPIVISVGNIQAGGSGKTPFCAWLAREHIALGRTVAIVSRGVGRDFENQIQISRPGSPASIELFGDEACLQRLLNKDVWIAVGTDRLVVIERLRQQGFSQTNSVVILDDSFQNLRICPSVRVVLLTDRLRSEVLFRDFDSTIRFADIRILTRMNADYRWNSSHWDAQVRWNLMFSLNVSGQTLDACGAIADTNHWKSMLELNGVTIGKLHTFEDHHRYTKDEILNIEQIAQIQNRRILTTGKDWVKISLLTQKPELWIFTEPKLTWVSDFGAKGEDHCRSRLYLK